MGTIRAFSLRRIGIIVVKDWIDVFKNRYILLIAILLPLLLTSLPLVLLGDTRLITGGQLGFGNAIPSFLQNDPTLSHLQPAERFQAALAGQFMLLFLILALPLPVAIAAYSIVGEKREHSLEPLLATPLSVTELLIAKGVAAAIPGVVSTWVSFIVYLIVARFVVLSDAVYDTIFNGTWLLAMLVVVPFLTLLSVSIGLIVSSRSSDPRAAEQLSTLVILPILILFFSQLLGASIVNIWTMLIMSALVISLDILLLRLAIRLFQRETILTRWK